MPGCVRAVLLTVVVACLTATAAGAQTQWLDRTTRNAARLEMTFPALGDEVPGTSVSYALFGTARVAVARDTWIVAEIPYARAHLTIDYPPSSRTGSTVGNPYLGIERALKPEGLRVEFGLRPSVVDASRADAAIEGFGGGVEHEEAFIPRAVHLRTAIAWQSGAGRHDTFGFAARVAPTWQIITRNPLVPVQEFYADTLSYVRAGRSSRLLIDYAASMRLQGPNARLAVGVAGRWTRTDADEYSLAGFSLAANSATELTLLFEVIHASVQPALAFRFPLDMEAKQFEAAHGAITLSVSVPFGRTARSGA